MSAGDPVDPPLGGRIVRRLFGTTANGRNSAPRIRHGRWGKVGAPPPDG